MPRWPEKTPELIAARKARARQKNAEHQKPKPTVDSPLLGLVYEEVGKVPVS